MAAEPVQNPAFVEVSDLSLSRGGRQLAQGLGFALAPGHVLLLRGPNGAGKSSLLLALAGVLRPEAGTIRWTTGEAPALHFLGHAAGLRPRLTLRETLRFWQALNGSGGFDAEPALEAVGLGGLGDIEAGHLSTGQAKRLGLARLLLSPRPVWLLDEPASSLDAEGQAQQARLVDGHAAAGGAAVIATHDELALTAPSATLRLGRSV